MRVRKVAGISICTLLFTVAGSLLFASSATTSESADQDPTAQKVVEQDRERIRKHLRSVEKKLRAKDVSQLSPQLQRARERNLDRLREYWKRGVFPHNTHAEGETPVFIDADGRHCAVGYLMKESGWQKEARAIAARENLARLPEMQSPEVEQWVGQSGLTAEEATLIQPTYCHLDTGRCPSNDTGTDAETNPGDAITGDADDSGSSDTTPDEDGSESESDGASWSDTSEDENDDSNDPQRACSTAPSSTPSPLFALGFIVAPLGFMIRRE